MSRDPDRRLFKWAYWLLLAAGAFTLLPMWLPLLLAGWFAHLGMPMVDWLERRLGGRRRPAVWIAIFLLVMLLVPFTVAVVQVVVAGSELFQRVMASEQWRGALQSLVANDTEQQGTAAAKTSFSAKDLMDPERVLAVVKEHGAVALGVLSKFFGATATAVVQLFVFFLAAYMFLYEGGKYWAWTMEHAPFDGRHMERFRGVFHETGQGLIIGVGLTALAQGIVATIAYLALGVPRALLFGELTFFAAFIPSFGTALVWVPVALGLALSGAYIKAVILGVIGVFVIGLIDNVMRPIFSRWGALDLPVFILLLSIFGGFTVFGAWGFLLGPLLVRLAKEALIIAREER